MTDDVSRQETQVVSARTRLAVLGALLAAGLVIALGAHALGLSTLTDSDPGASVRVSSDNVTVSADGTEVTAVSQMTNVTAVEISETDGEFIIGTDRDDPLTDQQRTRSLAIARANDTVKRVIAGLDRYTLTVEPIQTVTATETSNISVTITNISVNDSQASEELTTALNDTAENETFNVTFHESESADSDTVRVDRDPNYAEDRAVVYVRDPATDEKILSAEVDLQKEVVVSVTDWRDIS